MATYFDEIRAIALSNMSQSAKIKELQKKGKLTAAQARSQIETIIFVERSKGNISQVSREGRVRFTIGVEIECYNIDRIEIKDNIERRGLQAHITGYNHTDSKTSYKLGSDSSISGDYSCEVVSPVLRNLDSLKIVCEVINEAGAMVNSSCGLHVHFGASKFTVKQYQRIIMNYAAIEPIIDSFMPNSRRNNTYCKGLSQVAERLRGGDCDTIQEIQLYGFENDRYYKVNAMAYNTHKTIEFRQHNGTTNFEKIKNWVEFLRRFIEYSLKHEEILTASTIDELPFLTSSLKRFYNNRKETFAAL